LVDPTPSVGVFFYAAMSNVHCQGFVWKGCCGCDISKASERNWAYPLSLRHLEEMMAERGVSVDHSTVHRWAIKLLLVLEKAFRRRKRPVGKSWRMNETYIRVKGEWRYLYRAVDKDGNTMTFCYAPIGTRLQPGVTLRNRSPRMACPRR
jgi:hypothetical protein